MRITFVIDDSLGRRPVLTPDRAGVLSANNVRDNDKFGIHVMYGASGTASPERGITTCCTWSRSLPRGLDAARQAVIRVSRI